MPPFKDLGPRSCFVLNSRGRRRAAGSVHCGADWTRPFKMDDGCAQRLGAGVRRGGADALETEALESHWAQLIEAAADHGADAMNLPRIAVCEQSSDLARYLLAVEALLQAPRSSG